MEEEIQQVTSQGEFISRPNKDVVAPVPVHNEGALSDLWNKVHKTTDAAAHMAEMAAVIASEAAISMRDTTSDLLGKGLEKAHEAVIAVEHVGEKIVEQTKELVHEVAIEAEKMKESGAHAVGQKKEQVQDTAIKVTAPVKNTGSAALEKVPSMSEIHAQLQELAEIIIEQGKDKGAQLVQAATEKPNEVVQAGAEVINQASEGLPAVSEAVQEKVQELPKLSRSSSKKLSKLLNSPSEQQGWNAEALTLTMDVVSHIQRIADRTGDAVLHETARRAHSACAKGLSDAPGVHLTWITPQQANDLVNLAIRTQDHELADFARYCQSVAATTHIGVEPTPGKIQEEILKGYQELQQQGRVHTGPGYGAAFASVNRNYATGEGNEGAAITASLPSSGGEQANSTPAASPYKKLPAIPKQHPQQSSAPPELVLTMDVVSHIQRIADRTGNAILHETARKAHSACAKGLSDAPGVHLTWIAPQQASELMNLASKTQDEELISFARYCQSVAATTQIGVEPSPGKIQEEILKGRYELQQQLQQQQQQGLGSL